MAQAESGSVPRPGVKGQAYVVLQVILKEKLWGTGSVTALSEFPQSCSSIFPRSRG